MNTLVAVLVISVLFAAGMGLARPFEVGTICVVAGPALLSEFGAGSLTIDNIVTVGGTCLILVSILTSRRRWRQDAYFWYLVALSLCVALSSVANPGEGKIESLFRYGAILLLSIRLSVATSSERLFALRATLAIVALGACSIVQQPFTRWPDPFGAREGIADGSRYGGLFGHPNFGAYCIALGILAMAHFHFAPKVRWPSIALLGTAILMTGSRTALGVLALCLLFIAWRGRNRVAIILLGAATLAAPFATVTLQRFINIFSSEKNYVGPNAGQWRIQQWGNAIEIWQERPAFGVGWYNAPNLLPRDLGVHNSYLEILVESGIVGAIIFAAALVGLLRNAGGSLQG